MFNNATNGYSLADIAAATGTNRNDNGFGFGGDGACVDDTKKIYINNKLSLEKIKKVLCHEITHAAMFSYDIQLTYDQEELLADLLATYGQKIIDITNKIFSKIKNNRG